MNAPSSWVKMPERRRIAACTVSAAPNDHQIVFGDLGGDVASCHVPAVSFLRDIDLVPERAHLAVVLHLFLKGLDQAVALLNDPSEFVQLWLLKGQGCPRFSSCGQALLSMAVCLLQVIFQGLVQLSQALRHKLLFLLNSSFFHQGLVGRRCPSSNSEDRDHGSHVASSKE